MTEQELFAALFSEDARRLAATLEYRVVSTNRSVGPRILLRACYPGDDPRGDSNWCCPVGIMLRRDGINPGPVPSPTAAWATDLLSRAGKVTWADKDPQGRLPIVAVRDALRAFMDRFDGGHYIPERDLPRVLGVRVDA